MSEKLIRPYEISVWEDKLVQDGNETKFVENKLAVIGSDTMTGLNKVYNPVFNKKSNGERTLSFSLKYKYFDPYTGNEDMINPFAALLVNERKVKLHYDNQWYEFIIKDHSESSDGYEWTYTCSDAFVLELSKTGYNITFDAELNNNQGTARELTKETLKETDWRIGEVNPGKQFIAEPIYKAILRNSSSVDIINASGNDDQIPPTDSNIYLFYSYIKNQNGKFVQFIIRDEERDYTIDNKNVITDTNFRIITDLVYEEREINNQTVKGFWLKNSNNYTLIIEIDEAETKYQANRLAYNQKTTYDPVMQRTVDRFKIGDQEIYRYKDNVYSTSDVLLNFIANGENFNILEDGTLQGWNPYVVVGKLPDGSKGPGENIKKLELVTDPPLSLNKPLVELKQLNEVRGFLKVQFDSNLTYLYNSGFENNASEIRSVSKGEKFVFRWRAKDSNNNAATDLRLIVAKYESDTPRPYSYYYKHIDINNIILEFKTNSDPQLEPQLHQLNNIIKGGYIDNNSYYINGVAQVPSTKYIYEVKDNNENITQYVWKGGEFKEKTSDDDYLPYYYLVAEAQKTVPNSIISNPTEKYGIFLYDSSGSADPQTGEPYTYFIEDIQLTRFVEDGETNTPMLIGNIPVATTKTNDYYYLKPSIRTTQEEVKTYGTPEALKDELDIQGDIEPIYNEESEKVLSISVSQSNCFNILQTIAETFECWIDLEVIHDEKGYICRDNNGLLEKYVNLREYIGNDNWAGFKYGINLESIERTINSDEFVTKLIVDQSQSDYVDEGYVSITNAPSNISNESYILNFDYYYSQNLLNREETEKDRLDFINNIAGVNKQLQGAEEQHRNYSNSLIKIGDDRNIYTEMVDTAEEDQSLALADFQDLTGTSYENFEGRKKQAKLYDNKYYIKCTEIEVIPGKEYYETADGGQTFELVDEPSGNPSTKYYEIFYDALEEDNIIDIVGEIYVNSSVINNYSGLKTNINQEYQEVKDKLYGRDYYTIKIWTDIDANQQRHVFIELNDYLPGFTIKDSYNNEYVSTVSIKFFDIQTDSTEFSFIPPQGYSVKKGGQTISTYEITDDTATVRFQIKSNITIKGIIDTIDELLEEKTALIKEFNNKYSRFIQEGTWNSTEYIDPELYYLDALQVSNTSAQPTVSYTINVVEISQLEGFEWYKFDAGDKSYIEDTEFFGWTQKNGILTPAREEVIVSEVEWHLDEPDKNSITVQNYKTRFEDLFQRISATVQTVQYNEATYSKISTLLDANGTINQDVLLDSLNSLAGKSYFLTSNGSVIVNEDNILIRNLTNPANNVIINSEGVRVSSDGGQTFTTVIDGQGINIGAVYTGTLNTNEVIIGNKNNPSFRWDKAGINAYRMDAPAYKLSTDTEVDPNKTYYIYDSVNDLYTPVVSPSGNPQENGYYEYGESTDLRTFVRFDQYGLYGIQNNDGFRAESLEDIKNKAHFAVTWDGFFIKNSYADGGRVSITSDNDFQITKMGNSSEEEIIKIGMLELRPNNVNGNLYGMRIKGENNTDALVADSDGNLSITGTINALGGNFSDLVTVGKNTEETTDYIKIDGVSASISSSNYNAEPSTSATQGWIINKDGDAVFNNIIARGSIKTAVFEYAEIQAVGGIFIFRPSSTIRSAAVDGNNLILTVEKQHLFSIDDWVKISNYTTDGSEPNASYILQENGLTHVYRVSAVNNRNVTLENAAAMVEGNNKIVDIEDLFGGALVSMGHYENGIDSNNYGIGVNSSDNTVNLARRAISLFETEIKPNAQDGIRVKYNYRGILGTLPPMSNEVDASIYQYMQGTQGIYTDNMYIGDATQFISFYTDTQDLDAQNNPKKKLRIKANQVVFENPNSPTGWSDVSEATDPTQGGHFIYTTSVGTTPAGAGIIQNYSDNPTQWGYNTWISTRGIDLRHGEEAYATLNADGLILNKGGIESGELGTNDFVYLSTNDYPLRGPVYTLIDVSQYESANPSEQNWYELVNDEYQLTEDITIVSGKDYYSYRFEEGVTINGHTPSQENNDAAWREIIGQNFGVDAAGALYAHAGRIGDAIINGEKLILGDNSVSEAQLNIGKYITFGYGYTLITDPAQPPNWPENYYKPVDDGRIEEYEKVPSGTTYEPGKYYIKDENRPQLIIGNKETIAVTIDITSDNGQMTFWQDWKQVAYINNNRMTIPESVMLNEMKVGEKLWSWKHHDGNLCLKWLGD